MKRGMSRFFSILLIVVMLIGMIPFSPHHEHAHAATPGTLYFQSNGWESDGARIEAYFFGGSSGDKWVTMTNLGNGYFKCSAPTSGYPNVIFVRMNPSGAEHNWDSKWNQTADLTLPTDGKDCFSVSGWDNAGGSWGYYVCMTGTHNYAAATCTAAKTCKNCGATSGSAKGHSWSSSTGKCSTCGTACSHSWNSGTVTKAATCAATGVRTYTCNTCKTTKTETIPKTTNHNYAAATCTVAKKCTVCGITSGSALGHSYTSKVTKAATCAVTGVRTYTCSRSGCGHSYTETIPKTTTHSYGNASCNSPATCTVCGATTGSALGHNYAAATCTAPKTCTRCGVTTGSALGHSYSYKVTKNPTTSASGTLVGTCTRSGCSASTGNITIGYLGTKYHTYKVITAAGCTTAGTGRYTWGITDYGTYYWDVSIPATGHSYSSKVTAPTCTAQGYTTYTCSTCGNSYKDNYTAATGHSYSSKVTTAATCTTDGVRTYTCSNGCGSSYTEAIAALGHSYTGGKCGTCGDTKTVSLPGSFNDWNTNATMTYGSNGYTYSLTLSAGTYTFKVLKDGAWLGNNGEIWDTTTATSSVGWEFVDGYNDCVLVATGGTYNFTFNYDSNMLVITYNHTHKYNAGEVVAPTCTAKGYTVYTCACGDSYNGDETAAKGHGWNSGSITTQPGCTTEGVKTYTCNTCGTTKTESVAAAGHSYSSKVTAPTCTAQGYTTYTCSKCNNSYKDNYKDATGHSYTSKVTTAATCTTKGVRTYTCSNGCGSSYTEDIAALGHSYTAEVTAPTCTAQGYTTHTCGTCGNSYKDTYTDATGHSYVNGTCSKCGNGCSHNWGSGSVTTQPGCTTTGVRTYTCSVCKHTKTESIAANGHSYSSKVTAPTCTAQGYTTYTCGTCGDSYKDSYTDAKGHSWNASTGKCATCGTACDHSWNSGSVTTQPGCTTEGVKTYTCNTCKATKTESVAALGHSYSGGKCGACGDTKTVSLPGSFNDWNTDAAMTWTENGYTCTMNLSAGTYTFKVLKDGAWLGNNGTIYDNTSAAENGWKFEDAGDCTLVATGGSYTFTFHFDTDMLVVTNDHSHKHIAGEVVAPTCTAGGYTVYTCACGDSYQGDKTDALNHSYTSQVTTQPGCTTEGVKTFTCGTCGDSYTESVAALGHSYSGGKCGNCGDIKTVSLPGSFNEWNANTTMTWTESGYTYEMVLSAGTYKFKLIKDGAWLGNNGEIWDTTTATSDIGWEFAENTDDGTLVATGGTYYFTFHYDTNMLVITYNHSHKYNAGEVVAPTCTAGGYTVYTCACGDSYQGDKTDALNHSYTSQVTTQPGCTTEGVKTFTCGKCGDSYTESVAAIGHDYKATVTAPTCTDQGYTTHKCGNCGDSYVDSYVDATGHNYVGGQCTNCGEGCSHNWGTGKVTTAATCTSTGVRTYTCSVCNHTKTESIPALSHTEVIDAGKDATCTETGLTAGKHCSVCGEVTVAQTEIPALGHSYTGGKCGTCGDTKTVSLPGSFNEWNADAAMTWTENGYTCTMTLPAGTYTFKVLKDGAWLGNPGTIYDNTSAAENGWKFEDAGDCTLVATGGSYTFTFHFDTDMLVVTNDHTHSHTAGETTAPTCTEQGYTTYTCACGDSYKDGYVDALGHSYVAGKCTACGGTEQGYTIGFINGADYDGDDYLFADGKLVVTFTEGSYVMIKAGTFFYNAPAYVEGATSATLYPASESVFEKLFVPGNAEITFTLTAGEGDSFVLSYEISNCPHDYTSQQTKDPTCTEKGENTFTFYFDTDMLVVTNDHTHSHTAGEVTAPTCTEQGYTTYTCACGDSYKDDYVDALGHSYVAGKCTACGDQLSMYLIGFINGADYDGDEYLFADGKLVITFTEGSYVIIKAGTFFYNAPAYVEGATSATLYPASESVFEKLFVPGNAEITFTLTAGEGDSLILSYVTGECNHKYASEVIAPTCTEGGYTEHTCAYCGDSYTDTVTEALGHNYVDGICDRCGEAEPVVNYITVYFRNNWLWTDVYAYVYVGETYITPWPGEPATLYGNDGEFDVYCVTIPEGANVIFSGTKNDGSGESDQTPNIENAADGDCYSMIWMDKNAVEKDHIDNVIKPQCQHSYTSQQTKAPTCTEAGELTYTCSACGDSYTEEIAALGHTYGDDEICDVCGAQKPADYMTVYFRNDWLWTDVKLYYWGSTIAENPAWNGIAMELYGNDGQYDIYKLSVPTDITGLLFTGISNEGAEAQSPDVTSGWYDGICYYMFWDGADQILSDSIENILPDVCEHDYDVVTNEATCTTDGSVTYTCKLCGETKTEILTATGHNYVNGVCHCGATTDGVTIHLINTLGWSGTVAYAWENSTSAALNGWGWPGKIIHKDNEGYFTFHVDYEPGSGKALGLLFHNFNGAQTVDIVIDYATLSTSREIWIKPSTSANADGKFACTVAGSESGLVVSPEVNGNQVTFRYAGTASSVFLAGSFNDWSTSATPLVKGEDGIWSVTLTLDAGVHEYKFVADGSWIADPVNGVVGGYDGNSVVVVPADDETTNTGKVTVVLHFYRSSGDYAGWDTWFWSTASNGTSAAFSADPNNKGMIATFTVDGGTTSSVGFIVRKSDWSSQEFGDRYIDLTDVSSGTVHYYVNSGSATGLRVLGEDIFSAAKPVYANYNYEAGTVWLKTSLPVSNPVASAFSIVDGNGNATSISVTGVTLSGNGYALTLSKGLTLSQLNSYKVRYNGCDATISINVHDLFYSSKFANEYTYYGDDLGATWSYGSTTFKVWAPTAKAVSVKIYSSGNWGANDLLQNVAMTQGDKGVWYVTVSGNLHGKYYNYDVAFEGYTVEATDPYAKGTGVNGDRGMIVNMDATDPSGWDNDVSPNQGMSYTDAIIYETHIREFTIDASSGVDAAYRGKYLGLIQSGTSYQGYSTGLDYLKKLGITHIQLMPTYDFSSVDEYHLTDWEQYAWGYDPKNFSVPEGSYATDPYNGLTRITEFKEMVQTFHENGINVVMDVVYNHTFDGGNYCGNKIVPNYYSRFFGEGNWSNGSGVGNDFATERTMVRNLIVDNVLYWVEEYHIDGFRFDLAGLIDVQTINEIVSTVHAKYPYVIFYGEGWAPGGTAVQDNHALATKDNAWQTGGFGYFNDDFRNAIAGNNGNSWGFASGSWEFEDAIANYFRAGNSFSSSPSQTINYVSCHDNYCLTDKLLISRNGAYWSEIVKMNSLSNALVLLSEGIPFIYSGEEMLREKKDGDGNRYDNAYGTNDYINKIRWDDLVNKQYASTVSDYYAGLIEFRKNHAALRSNNNGYIYSDVAYHRISDQTILFYINGSLNGDCSDGIVVIFNAAASSVSVDLSNYGLPNGYWQACIHGDKAGINPLWGVNVGSAEDTIGVDAISTTVLVLGDLVDEGSIYNRQPSSCSHANHNTSAMCTSCGKTVSHSYVGGTCSVCGLSSSAPSTYTVYFDNSVTNWQSVNIYAWTKTAGMTKEYTGTWSGATMTLVDEANGIWAYELPIGATNIIFNDGSGNQSSDLTAPGYTSDKVLYSDGIWTTYEACAHEFEDTVIYEATCTMDGEVTHTCTLCGYSYTEVIQASGHQITDTVTEPTCTTGGYTIHACANCDYSITDSETAKLGHSYGDSGICGTCGAELKYYLFGYINGANYGSDGDEATMGTYIFADGQLTATFTQSSYVAVKTTDNEKWYMTNGYHEGVTSVPLYDTSVGIDANKLPVPGGIEITFTLTVNEDGTLTLSYTADTATCQHLTHSTEGICSVCDAEVAHEYVDGKCQCGLECEHEWIFGTCGNCGMVCEHSFEEGVCSICGAINPETCEHSYESVTVDPTCTTGGYTTHTCTLCGTGYTDSETQALGHSYGEDGLCTGCGAVNPETCEHTYESQVTEPTCTTGGFTTYTCTLCGHSYTGDNTEPADHTYGEDGICTGCGKVNPDTCVHEYEAVVTEPTCTEPGFTTHTCTICGDSYTDSETQALGHSYGEDDLCTGCGLANPETCVHEYEAVVTEPTCTEPGYTTHTCKLCGTSHTDTETQATGHEYDENGVCVRCGEITDCVHEYESVTVEPTCEEEGYTTHTCTLCGHAYTDDIQDALGHDYVDGTCSICGGKDTENCEHEYVKTTVTASCTEPGGDKYTCSKCGDSYLENATDALGHTYDNGICSACGDLKPLSTTYYLVGWINGGNHGCEEDGANMGNYPITDNMFKYTFDQTSYVFLKTEGNGKWFMCDGYPGDGVCFANLYDTSLPIQHDKVNVPGGIEITFTLIERDDGSVTLTYVTAGNCSHNWYTQTLEWPGCTTTGTMLHRCIMCADSYTTTIPAKGHSYNGGSNCWDCGAANPNYNPTYHLVGWINGSNVGCEENWDKAGYTFSGGRLTLTFTDVSYVYLKTHDNAKWYMTDGYPGDDATSARFYDTNSGIDQNKLRVPAGVPITFYLTKNSDGSLTLSYTKGSCNHDYSSYISTAPGCTTTGVRTYNCSKCGDSYDETLGATGHNYVDGACAGCGDITADYVKNYYLYGWINGANYGCEDDYANMGQYKFVDGKLVCMFEQDSYVAVKTSGNQSWYMAQSYIDTATGTLYNTSTGAAEKMFVPKGMTITFTLTVNADDTLTLSYTATSCEHTYDEGVVTTEPTCNAEGVKTFTCSQCGDSYTETVEMIPHTFEGDTCTGCGMVCEHTYEMTVIDASCIAYADYKFVCSNCGNTIVLNAEDMDDWMDAIPELMPSELFEIGTLYRYRDYLTLISNEPTIEGYEVVTSYWASAGMENVLYVAQWPAGFDTTSELYAQYGTKLEAFETESEKLEILSDELAGYIYYHWHNAEGAISDVQTEEFNQFCAFYSDIAPDALTANEENLSYEFGGENCASSGWYFAIEVYQQTAERSVKEYLHGKWDEWTDYSEEEAVASETRQVETKTVYRLPDVKLGEHVYESQITAPSCTEPGYTTHTCTVCGDSYTDSETEPTGHSYGEDGICTACGAEKPAEYMTIYFQNNWNWSDVKLYYWGSTIAENPEWPGIAMELFGNDGTYDIYCLTIPTDITGLIIDGIKDDGSETLDQTPDIMEGWYDGICYYMTWEDGNAVGSEPIENVMPDCEHSYDEGTVTTEATCTTAGVKTYTCQLCGGTKTEEIPALGHSYGDDNICDICGQEQVVAQTMTIYFQNNWLWTNVRLYYWIDGVETPAWPGTDMELCGNDGTYDIYKLTIPADITGLIINGANTDGNDDKTPDILEGWYDGICYSMIWNDGNQVESENIGVILPPDEPVVVPTITVGNPSVSFEGEIRYNFYFLVDDMSSVEEMGLALFREKLTDGTVSTAFQVISTFEQVGEIYMVHTDGIAPKNMADAVYFKIYAKLTDGTYVYSTIRGYNAVVYANNILKKSDSAQMKALVVAMLNYGAEAQKYFGYNTDALMNAHLTAEQQALVAAYDESMVDPVLAVDMNKVGAFARTETGFTGRRPSVTFDGAFSINYYMTTAFAPEGDVKLYVWRLEDYLSADVLTAENASECLTMVSTGAENQYWANVSDIVAVDVDQTVFVACVYTSGGVTYCSGVLNYSVGAYCESGVTLNDSGSNLCAAAAVYCYYAKEYFASLEAEETP